MKRLKPCQSTYYYIFYHRFCTFSFVNTGADVSADQNRDKVLFFGIIILL